MFKLDKRSRIMSFINLQSGCRVMNQIKIIKVCVLVLDSMALLLVDIENVEV